MSIETIEYKTEAFIAVFIDTCFDHRLLHASLAITQPVRSDASPVRTNTSDIVNVFELSSQLTESFNEWVTHH